jgi:hypothetical protein
MSDSVRDRIAELERWELVKFIDLTRPGSILRWCHSELDWELEHEVHPIPDTLDEAAKLPEGWGGEQVFRMVNAPYRWYAMARRIGQTRWRYGPEDSDGEAELLDPYAWGDTEKEARFALRLAVLEHIAKETP